MFSYLGLSLADGAICITEFHYDPPRYILHTGSTDESEAPELTCLGAFIYCYWGWWSPHGLAIKGRRLDRGRREVFRGFPFCMIWGHPYTRSVNVISA